MKKRLFAMALALVVFTTAFCGCTSTKQTKSKGDEKFRVTAYVTLDSIKNFEGFEKGHINEVTDVILIGAARFDEEGKITLDESYAEAHKNLKAAVDAVKGVRLHLAVLGPGNQSESDDWNDQMNDQAMRHNNAFKSGNLEKSIKDLLIKDGYDGVYFDYEYPIRKKDWKKFNDFIVVLDEYLGDSFTIGMALGAWNMGQNKKAIKATDFVQIMSYDTWGEDGTHSTVSQAEKDIKTALKRGYDPKQLELGVPFYARPTTQEPYWYGYNGYYKDIDEKGFCKDKETGLTFSFNTCDVIKQKTSYAIDMGLGGVMVWHYACDAAYGDEKSLFKAIDDAVKVAEMRE